MSLYTWYLKRHGLADKTGKPISQMTDSEARLFVSQWNESHPPKFGFWGFVIDIIVWVALKYRALVRN